LQKLLNREFGGDSNPLIEIALHRIEDKHVCEVRVKPRRRVYMLIEAAKDVQTKQQFYIRGGNQTVAVIMEEASARRGINSAKTPTKGLVNESALW
jgi:hypothetical protein